jgi:alpha-galactosidase
VRSDHDGIRARIEAADMTADLQLVTDIEAVPGGAIRARHTVTNTGGQPYVVDNLEVVFPVPARVGEILDFTGRQTAERIPQRHRIGDGLWLREGRRGHTGHDSATVMVAGVPVSASAAARCTGSTSPGAATPCTAWNGCRPAWAWRTGLTSGWYRG